MSDDKNRRYNYIASILPFTVGEMKYNNAFFEATALVSALPHFAHNTSVFLVRRAGTGCLLQISPKKWEGSYSPKLPNGKRKKFNIYANAREECEEKLAGMIKQKNAEKNCLNRDER